jgi:hypothetical protein
MDFLGGSHSMPSAIPMKELAFSRFFRAYLRAAVKALESQIIRPKSFNCIPLFIKGVAMRFFIRNQRFE